MNKLYSFSLFLSLSPSLSLFQHPPLDSIHHPLALLPLALLPKWSKKLGFEQKAMKRKVFKINNQWFKGRKGKKKSRGARLSKEAVVESNDNKMNVQRRLIRRLD